MSNILELRNNQDAEALAAPYENINSRKEVYVKSLIVSALKKNTSFVKTEESLFYSKKFYAMAGIFDFYVNNNVFDLIVLKPDSDELLFDAVNDDIHSNIYGYVVARISEDLKSTKILGYFMSKDFAKVINDGMADVELLKDINTLSEIDALESQMSLDEVSERFFELVSQFLDEDISMQNMSELACLLYNSAELRQVFAEIGRFDNICADMKDNQDLIHDDFLSVLAGDDDSEEESEEDELVLEALETLGEEEPPALQPEDIDLGVDLSELVQPEQELAEEAAETTEELDALAAEVSDEDIAEETSLEEMEDSAEEETDFETLETEVNLEEQDSNEADVVEETPELELDTFEINLEDLKEEEPEAVGEDVDVSSDGSENEVDFDGLISQNENTDNVEPALSSEDELSLEFDEEDLDSLEVLEEVEENSEEKAEENSVEIADEKPEENDAPVSKLAAELAALSAKKHQEEEQKTEPVEPEVEPVSSEAPAVTADDELMAILGEEQNDNIIVDENEFLSILGIDEAVSASNTPLATNEAVPEKPIVDVVEPEGQETNSTPDENPVSIEQPESHDEPDSELQLLYTENDTTTAGAFPGDGIVNPSPAKLKLDGSKKKTVVVAALLALLVVGGGVSLMVNKGSNSNNNVVSDLPQNNDIAQEDNFSLSTNPDDTVSNAGMPTEEMPPAPQPEVANSNETKIVSSLSKQAGAAPVILKSVAWQVPTSMTSDVVFSKYLQIAGKNIKLNLATDLLGTDDFAYNNKIKVSMTVRNNSPVKNVKIIESSGSKDVDDIVLQSIKQTLKYINSPVMTTDTGDKDVVLVISI